MSRISGTPATDLERSIRARMFERGIVGAQAEAMMAKIRARLAAEGVANPPAPVAVGSQRAVGNASIPAPVEQPDPAMAAYDKFLKPDGGGALTSRTLMPKQVAATPEEIQAGGMKFQAPPIVPTEKTGMLTSAWRAGVAGAEDVGDYGAVASALSLDNGVTIDVANRIAMMAAHQRGRPVSESYQRMTQAAQGGAKSLLSFTARNPGAAFQGMLDVSAQSLGQTGASIAAAALAPSFSMAAIGAGSGMAEAAGGLIQALEEEKVDVTDGAAIARAMNTPEIRQRIRTKVLSKAYTVGTIDALTGKLSSMIPGGKTFLGKLASGAGETTVEMAGGGAGEALGQMSQGKKLSEVNGADVLLEMGGELLPGVATAGSHVANRVIRGPAPVENNGKTAKTPQQPAETPEQRRVRMQADLRAMGQEDLAARVGQSWSKLPVDPLAAAKVLEDELRARMAQPATPPSPSPVGSPSPADQSATSPTEQGGTGAARPGSREEVTARMDQKIASGMDRESAFKAVQQELTAEAEDRLSVDGEILVDEYGDEWQVEHFRTKKDGPKDQRSIAKLTNENGDRVPPNERSTVLGNDAIVFARSLRRRSEVGSKQGGTGAPSVQAGDRVQWTSQGAAQFETPRTVRSVEQGPDGRMYAMVEGTETGIPVEQLSVEQNPDTAPGLDPYAEAEQNLLRQRAERKKARAAEDEIAMLDGAVANIRAKREAARAERTQPHPHQPTPAKRDLTFDEQVDANILAQRNARRAAKATKPAEAPKEETPEDIAIRAIMEQRAAAKTKRQVRDIFRNRANAPMSEEQAAAFRAEQEDRRAKIREQRTSPPLSRTEQQYQDERAQRVARIRAQREDPNFADKLGTQQWPAEGQIRGAKGQWPAVNPEAGSGLKPNSQGTLTGSTQPQGGDAATTNKETANGEEAQGNQEGVLTPEQSTTGGTVAPRRVLFPRNPDRTKQRDRMPTRGDRQATARYFDQKDKPRAEDAGGALRDFRGLMGSLDEVTIEDDELRLPNGDNWERAALMDIADALSRERADLENGEDVDGSALFDKDGKAKDPADEQIFATIRRIAELMREGKTEDAKALMAWHTREGGPMVFADDGSPMPDRPVSARRAEAVKAAKDKVEAERKRIADEKEQYDRAFRTWSEISQRIQPEVKINENVIRNQTIPPILMAINEGTWTQMLETRNPVSRATYEALTGFKLPKNNAGTKAAVTQMLWKQQKPAPAPAPKPPTNKAEAPSGFNVGDEVYITGDNGYAVTRVVEIKTMFGKPHLKLWNAEKWFAADDPRISKERPKPAAPKSAPAPQPPPPAPSPAPKPAPAPSGSKLSPEKQAELARLKAEFKKKLGGSQLNMGVDPELLSLGVRMAALYLEDTALKFADFSRKLIDDIGEEIRPYLKSIYMGASAYPGLDATGLDNPGTVFSFDLDSIQKGPTDAVQDNTDQPDGNEPGGKPDLPGADGAPGGEPDADGNPPVDGDGEAPDAPADGGEPGNDGGGAPDGGGNGVSKRGQGGNRRGGRSGKRSPSTGPDGKPTEPGPTEQDPKVQDLDGPAAPDVPDLNHKIGADDVLAPSGQKAKIRGNIRAITLLKKLEAENRNPTPEEKKVLAQYVGFGPIGEVVNRAKAEAWEIAQQRTKDWGYEQRVPDDVKSWVEKYYDDYKTIRDSVTRDEFEAITASTRNAHYTSKDVIAGAIWPILKRLGFTGGNILETSAGIGHMIGLMPAEFDATSKWTAVELDNLTSRILAKLYPQANVINSPFQTAGVRRNVFDAIVGNVPFARDVQRTEEGYPDFSLHNYFLAKSIDMLRPGGVMAVISSISSMDADASREWREWMNERADLVGSIRLPNNAFEGSANTKVTTDIMVFRKKDTNPWTGRQEFSYTTQLDTGEKGKQGGTLAPIPLNVYYQQHPEMMLGRMSALGSMYGGINQDKAEPTLEPFAKDYDLAGGLARAVESFPQNLMQKGDATTNVVEAPAGTRMYSFYDDGGKVSQRTAEGVVTLEGQDAKIARQYMNLRDLRRDLVDQQVAEDSDEAAMEATRSKLRDAYREFVRKHGNVNDLGRGARALLEIDADFNRVASLENVVLKPKLIGQTKKGKPNYRNEMHISEADILTKRTQWPFREPTKADSWEDAVLISQFYRGTLSIPYVASLMGETEKQASISMRSNGLVFVDPENGQLVSKSEYLSGNIREKLRIAEREAAADPSYSINVEALKSLIPAPMPLSKIKFQMGATWIPVEAYQKFTDNMFGPGVVRMMKLGTGTLAARAADRASSAEGQANNKRFGTSYFSGIEVFKSIIEINPLVAYDEVTLENGSKSKRKNPEASADAELKADLLRTEFERWARTSESAPNIEQEFNDNYVAIIPRQFDPPPFEHFPGASTTIKLRDYQRRAVMRGVAGAYLNAHEVGMGKTFTGITTAMEWRRLGIAKKPLVVVQPSTYLQFAGSWNQLYPQANILVPTAAEMKKENRHRLIARIATGDWDGIVIPQTLFNQISVSARFASDFILGEIDALTRAHAEAMLTQTGRGTPPTAKKLQEQIDYLREYLQKKLDGADADALLLDELGVDGMIVDEAHDYKNSYFRTGYTQLKGVNSNASERSLDMLLKTKYVQQKVGMGRNLVLMTGTPVSNTVGEAWVMMRYVRPDLLRANNINSYDDFAGAFTDISAKEEFDATNRLKPQLRMRGFKNVKQFQAVWLSVVDVVRYEQLPKAEREKINRPKIRGGKPTMIELDPTAAVLARARELVARYEWFESLRGKARYQNRHVPGVINTQARKLAIDPRMVGIQEDHPNSKVNNAVRNLFERWQSGKDQKTTQVLFSDLYQDNPDAPQFNVFEDIRNKLIEMGVPKDEIVIALDLSDSARAALFQKVNDGDVRIVMGTTQKLGVGVNIQTRLEALHHLDAPYRPMDMEQREGRIIRFGNLVKLLTGNDPEIIRYGVKRTFDSGQYGRLERKQRAVNDTLSGVATESEVESSGEDMLLSFAEAAAAFSGNPDMLLKGEIEGQLRSLRAERSGFEDALLDLRRSLETAKMMKRDAENVLAAAIDWKKNRLPVWEKTNNIRLPDGKTVAEADASKALDAWMQATMKATREKWESTSTAPRASEEVGTIVFGGIPFAATSYLSANDKGNYSSDWSGIYLTIPPELAFSDNGKTNLYRSGSGLIQRVSAAIQAAKQEDTAARKRIDYQEARIADLEQKIPTLKFDKEAELLDLESQLETVLKRLRAKKEDEISSAGPKTAAASKIASAGASPAAPDRFDTSTVADRLEKWADEQARMLFRGGVARRGPRGSRGGMTTLHGDVVKAVAVIGARALAKTIRGGTKLTALVNDSLKEFQITADPIAIRRAVGRFIKAAKYDENNFDRVYHDLTHPKVTRAEKRAAAKARRTAAGALTAERTETPTVGATEALRASLASGDAASKASADAAVSEIRRAVNRAYRSGIRMGRKAAEDAIPGLIGTIVRQRSQLRALAGFEARGAREEERGKMAEAQAIRDGIRAQVVEYAKTLPPAVRGKLVGSITAATTPMAYLRTVRALDRALMRHMGRDLVTWIAKRTTPKRLKNAKGMTDDLRQAMVRWRSEAAVAYATIKDGEDLTQMRAAVIKLLRLRELMGVAIETSAAAYRQIAGARRESAIDIANQTVEDIQAAAVQPKTTEEQKDYEVSKVVQMLRGARDIRNVIQDITGKFGSSLEVVMFKAFDRAEEQMFARERELRAQLERAVKAAGFADLAEAQRTLSGRGGDGMTSKVRATLGGISRVITLGEAIDLLGHASDPMTMSLFLTEQGQGVQSERGKKLRPMVPDPTEIDALAEQVDPDGRYRRMIDEFKDIFESTREDTWRVFYTLKGFEPEAVDRRWPRARNMQALAETASLPESAAGMVNKFLENDGRFESRKQTTGIPILLRDPISTALDEISTSVRTIYLAIPTRDAANVLFQTRLAGEISERWGASLHNAMKQHLVYMSRADKVQGTAGARAVAAFNSYRAVSSLGLNPGTWIVTAVSALRLLPELGAKYWAKGLVGIPDISMAELMRKSGHAWDRYEGSKSADRFSAVVSGGVEPEGPNEFKAEILAAVKNIAARDPGASLKNLQRAARTTMAALNWFDALNYRLAWAGYAAKAAELHPEWSQARRDRWIANKARAEIRETQQGSSPLDAAMGPTRVRDTGLSMFTLFSSDVLKSRNRIRRAFRRSYSHGTAALAAEVTSTVLGSLLRKRFWAVFSALVAGLLGWDDEDEKRLTDQITKIDKDVGNSTRELSGIVLPIIGPNVVNGFQFKYNTNFIDAPTLQAINETATNMTGATTALQNAMQDRATGKKVFVAWARFANNVAGVAGVNPLEPWNRRIITEIDRAR